MKPRRRTIPTLESLDHRDVPSVVTFGTPVVTQAPVSGTNFFQNGFNYGTFAGGLGILRGHIHFHAARPHATAPNSGFWPIHGIHPGGGVSFGNPFVPAFHLNGAGTSAHMTAPLDPPVTAVSGTNFFQNGFNYGTFAGGMGILR